jgi:hypothetical protein
MLDSLKDMYISYPFLQLDNAPDWFAHIKDIRCVITFDAVTNDAISTNGCYVRAWLTEITDTTAKIKVICSQIQEQPQEQILQLISWTAWRKPKEDPVIDYNPAEPQSYVLVDDDFSAPSILTDEYELNPGTLTIMQKAPALYIGSIRQPIDLHFNSGNNVSVSKSNNGVLLFGGSDVGLGKYTSDPLHVLGPHQQGLGARNINGLDGSVWLKGTFPVTEHRERVGQTPNTEFSVTVGED